ncbi:glutamyl-tRNA synthetase [Mesotoga sp. HF07.pep.5.2.highcov]|uniref:Glutamate--tRNA ligase n=1 Tax=Mesotoga prima MesG1.Ag.4.2 TaxID=660470 RepID=I2F6G6_9BACT|nr:MULTISPECIES: glutamate--tRNA ligase [Mesotoga]AFK07519.1 glutamyl-tRNA synthetase [Mesotoga prima MesG1.Ag.4.2]PIJ60399.1 glutamyl-tRNA synthetase [Mesotoga sp. H07.pep.5.3]RLL84979.1 glutamyl-tRNA synthetase [Mesotoga sp. H07pep.5.4]RLL91253.1 glutamyl-tRNA synthetase [Mesotoga sp. HF07.pep.5.2.highcov]
MVRCRFAPSPTGNLHVGGVRTALFNWLFAKNQNGSFVLRIEDTDTERSEKRFEDQILSSMKWCGLNWSEGPDIGGEYGPYRQSERVALGFYDKYAQELVERGHAYYAVYKKSNQEDVLRISMEMPDISGDEVYTIKFRIPEGKTEFSDLSKGKMSFENENFSDFIIIKSNGFPTYNFAVVVDDHMMDITHVFRGEDHLTNTPRQIMIYRALDWEPPTFMHIPLILGSDRAPLSKRHGHTSVDHFREEGYLSVGLMNYLALLGWTVDEEIFDYHEKVKDFIPSDISNKGVVFDYEKLEWINGKHLRLLDPEELMIQFGLWLKFTGRFDYYAIIESDQFYSREVLTMCREKINTLEQLFDFSAPFFSDELDYQEEYVSKYLQNNWSKDLISAAIRKFEDSLDWSVEGVEKTVRELADEKIASKKNTFQTLRGGVTGRLVTPGLFETISVLGRDRVLERLENLLEMIEYEEGNLSD